MEVSRSSHLNPEATSRTESPVRRPWLCLSARVLGVLGTALLEGAYVCWRDTAQTDTQLVYSANVFAVQGNCHKAIKIASQILSVPERNAAFFAISATEQCDLQDKLAALHRVDDTGWMGEIAATNLTTVHLERREWAEAANVISTKVIRPSIKQKYVDMLSEKVGSEITKKCAQNEFKQALQVANSVSALHQLADALREIIYKSAIENQEWAHAASAISSVSEDHIRARDSDAICKLMLHEVSRGALSMAAALEAADSASGDVQDTIYSHFAVHGMDVKILDRISNVEVYRKTQAKMIAIASEKDSLVIALEIAEHRKVASNILTRAYEAFSAHFNQDTHRLLRDEALHRALEVPSNSPSTMWQLIEHLSDYKAKDAALESFLYTCLDKCRDTNDCAVEYILKGLAHYHDPVRSRELLNIIADMLPVPESDLSRNALTASLRTTHIKTLCTLFNKGIIHAGHLTRDVRAVINQKARFSSSEDIQGVCRDLVLASVIKESQRTRTRQFEDPYKPAFAWVATWADQRHKGLLKIAQEANTNNHTFSLQRALHVIQDELRLLPAAMRKESEPLRAQLQLAVDTAIDERIDQQKWEDVDVMTLIHWLEHYPVSIRRDQAAAQIAEVPKVILAHWGLDVIRTISDPILREATRTIYDDNRDKFRSCFTNLKSEICHRLGVKNRHMYRLDDGRDFGMYIPDDGYYG